MNEYKTINSGIKYQSYNYFLDKQLYDAIIYGECNKLYDLLENGIIIDDLHNSKALEMVAELNNYDILKILLTYRKESNYPDKELSFVTACENGNIEIAKLLIECGVDINYQNGYPMYKACENERLGIVKLLIENSVIIEQRLFDPITATIISGNSEILKLLVDNGAKVRADLNIYCTIENKMYNFALQLVQYGIDPTVTIKTCLMNNDYDGMKFLIENGANIHLNNDEIVKIAAANGYYDIVKLLIENGSDIHSDNRALYYAIHQQHCSVAKLLLENGADVNSIEFVKKDNKLVLVLDKDDNNLIYFKKIAASVLNREEFELYADGTYLNFFELMPVAFASKLTRSDLEVEIVDIDIINLLIEFGYSKI